MFFNNLHGLMEQYNFGPESIYNIDESGLTMVQRPTKVVAEKGCKQVGKMTSAERGALVTICATVNAIGNHLPPFLVFPRVNFKDHMLKGAPPGSTGVASGSGWMTAEKFIEFLRHFEKHVKCCKEKPVLLILDNHESHISIPALNFAKEHGIVMLTFPPHCSHKLQPLDRSVFGPLKRYYNAGCDAWMLRNPGKPMTIYDISEVLGYAFPLAFTSVNITAGFRVSGIWPFNRDIFADHEYLSAYVTDRPQESLPAATTSPGMSIQVVNITPSRSTDDAVAVTSRPTPTEVVTPQNLRPHPKAGPRKATVSNQKRKRKSVVLTSTPVKRQIEVEFELKKLNFSKKGKAKLKKQSHDMPKVSQDKDKDISNKAKKSVKSHRHTVNDYVKPRTTNNRPPLPRPPTWKHATTVKGNYFQRKCVSINICLLTPFCFFFVFV
jgi:DDE superfamily endonuclease